MSCTRTATGAASPTRRRDRAGCRGARSASARCGSRRSEGVRRAAERRAGAPAQRAAIAARTRRPTCCPSPSSCPPGIDGEDDALSSATSCWRLETVAARGRRARHRRSSTIFSISSCTACCICWAIDHETDAEAEAMERLEVEIWPRLGIADPYAAPVARNRPIERLAMSRQNADDERHGRGRRPAERRRQQPTHSWLDALRGPPRPARRADAARHARGRPQEDAGDGGGILRRRARDAAAHPALRRRCASTT